MKWLFGLFNYQKWPFGVWSCILGVYFMYNQAIFSFWVYYNVYSVYSSYISNLYYIVTIYFLWFGYFFFITMFVINQLVYCIWNHPFMKSVSTLKMCLYNHLMHTLYSSYVRQISVESALWPNHNLGTREWWACPFIFLLLNAGLSCLVHDSKLLA